MAVSLPKPGGLGYPLREIEPFSLKVCWGLLLLLLLLLLLFLLVVVVVVVVVVVLVGCCCCCCCCCWLLVVSCRCCNKANSGAKPRPQGFGLKP